MPPEPSPMPAEAAPEAASPPPEPEAAATVPAVGDPAETDPEMTAMFEERERRLGAKRSKAKLATNVLLLALVVAPVVAVTTHPGLRAKFESLVGHLGQGIDDVKALGSTTDNYDEALNKIAVRGDQIDKASRAIGVDPDKVAADDDPGMTREIAELAGKEEAETLGGRGTQLKQLGRMTGSTRDDESGAE